MILPISAGSMSIWATLAFLAKVFGFPCQTVIKSTTNTDHEIRLCHGDIGREGSVHPSHP